MTGPDTRVAIITGASRGIGAGLVAAYREQGWVVIANSRNGQRHTDGGVIVVEGDVADPETGGRLVDAAVQGFGRIDTLVNNAGLFISKPFTDYTQEDYRRVVGVNLTGFFTLTQRVIAHMVERRSGHVVMITTTLADYANSAVPSVLTSLTKGGLAAATKALAIEYASRGIRANAVSPGVIRTAADDRDSYDRLADLHPLGRVGEVDDVVAAVLFLEQSSFVTGEILHVDGGQSAGH